MIAFAGPEVADEWWCAMSTHRELSKWIKLISPQLYMWTKSNMNEVPKPGALYDSQEDGMSHFYDKMVYLWQSGNNEYGAKFGSLGILPMQDAPDLASGNSFFIRSKVELHGYWCCPTTQANCAVYTSCEERTPFVVSFADTRVPQRTIMIGTDEVIICPAVSSNMLLDCTGEDMRLADKGTGQSVNVSDVRTKFVGGDRLEIGNISSKPLVAVVGGGKYGNWELI
ncbi:hypothetical protein FIBSPDRAFT_938767 [Athelia psychrophila]|uniref:Uncharacterized protein n=1 Tax=Athelia psychrophila TaxID=1759441 RepID=A0A165XTQ1_9AGAM|nr:hypothetical protein FIBSPDRAFT_938767 [Fibularhizoctonia sp. CBS 109695]